MVTARKKNTTRGIRLLSSLMPFHSWPVVVLAGDGIAFAYRHGWSSSSRMLSLASWNRFRLEGQNA